MTIAVTASLTQYQCACARRQTLRGSPRSPLCCHTDFGDRGKDLATNDFLAKQYAEQARIQKEKYGR